MYFESIQIIHLFIVFIWRGTRVIALYIQPPLVNVVICVQLLYVVLKDEYFFLSADIWKPQRDFEFSHHFCDNLEVRCC